METPLSTSFYDGVSRRGTVEAMKFLDWISGEGNTLQTSPYQRYFCAAIEASLLQADGLSWPIKICRNKPTSLDLLGLSVVHRSFRSQANIRDLPDLLRERTHSKKSQKH